jgi:hypothetical protein
MNKSTNILSRFFGMAGCLIGDGLTQVRKAVFGLNSKEMFEKNYGPMIPTFHCYCEREAKYGYDKDTKRYWIQCKVHPVTCFVSGSTAHEAETKWLGRKDRVTT